MWHCFNVLCRIVVPVESILTWWRRAEDPIPTMEYFLQKHEYRKSRGWIYLPPILQPTDIQYYYQITHFVT